MKEVIMRGLIDIAEGKNKDACPDELGQQVRAGALSALFTRREFRHPEDMELVHIALNHIANPKGNPFAGESVIFLILTLERCIEKADRRTQVQQDIVAMREKIFSSILSAIETGDREFLSSALHAFGFRNSVTAISGKYIEAILLHSMKNPPPCGSSKIFLIHLLPNAYFHVSESSKAEIIKFLFRFAEHPDFNKAACGSLIEIERKLRD